MIERKCFNNNWFYFWNRSKPELITADLVEYSGLPESEIPKDEESRYMLALEVGLIKNEWHKATLSDHKTPGPASPSSYVYGIARALEEIKKKNQKSKPALPPLRLGQPVKLSDVIKRGKHR